MIGLLAFGTLFVLGAMVGISRRDAIQVQAKGIKAAILSGRGAANAFPESVADSSVKGSREGTTKGKTERPDKVLGHYRYDPEEAVEKGLVRLNPDSEIMLRPAAQAAVSEMIAKAKAEGVQLGIVSGWRSKEVQEDLFYTVQAERGENPSTRAEVSAPPYYSEHHTGYAVDFIDESQPDTHTEESFETTAAFRWLQKNAAFYRFEMSFPKDPDSPVGYEPWHWRYYGDTDSLKLFYNK